MTWEQRLFALFDDLEQQAEGLALRARDTAAGELARAHYAEVGLAARLHASVGGPVELVIAGAGTVRGRLLRVAQSWCLLAPDGAPDAEWVVNLAGLLAARGLAAGATAEESRPLTSRLGIGSALRHLAEDREVVVVVRSDGQAHRGRIARVGHDFVELAPEGGGLVVIPTAAVATVRPG